jgi:cytochrome c peroxidase
LAPYLLRVTALPLHTLKNIATGEIVEISDPGAALQTGKWKDIGRVKVPSLRAMASRAPYFHNGSAKELNDVVRFYDKRFAIGFTAQEMLDLTAFLSAL